MRRVPAAPARAHAGKPGPGPVPDAVLRSLDLAVMRRIQSLVPGDHVTPQVGAGTELALIRPYQPGDDVRYIDWNVTARMREPHVRVHVGERAMTAWLVLDVSPSMAFGTALRRKADVAEGVSLAVGHVATRRGNRLGVVAFGGARAARPAPAPGPPRAARAARRAARRAGARRRGRDVARRRDATSSPRSPARAGSWWSCPTSAARATGSTALRSLRARHGVLAVEVRDPRELELPAAGDVWMVDPETGARSSSTRAGARSAAASRPPPRPTAPRSPRRCGARAPTISCSPPTATGCTTWRPTCGAPTGCGAAR